MFKKFTNGCVHLVNRYLPDPFIFCIIFQAEARAHVEDDEVVASRALPR